MQQPPSLPGSNLLIPQNDPRVHQNLVNMMDRRLSNVQLMRSSRSNSAHSQASSLALVDESGYPASIVRQPRSHSHSGPLPGQQYPQQQYQQQQRPSNASNNYYQRQGSNANSYQTYQAQAAYNKRRRTTFWETLTGLVCSLGALATRAAKMAAKRAEPL